MNDFKLYAYADDLEIVIKRDIEFSVCLSMKRIASEFNFKSIGIRQRCLQINTLLLEERNHLNHLNFLQLVDLEISSH